MAKSRGGFSIGGSTDSAKKNVTQLNELGKAIKYLTANIDDLTQEQRKNAEAVKKANDANSKASEIIAKKYQPAFKYLQKEFEKIEEIQRNYNETVKEHSLNISTTARNIQDLKEEIKDLQKTEEEADASDRKRIQGEIKLKEKALKKEEEEVKKHIALQKEAVDEFEKQNGRKNKILQESIKDEEKLYNERMSKVDETFKKTGKLGEKSFKGLEEALGGIDTHLTEISKMSSLGDLGRGAKSIGESFEKVGATIEAIGGGRLGRTLSGMGSMITKAMGPIGTLVSIAETLMSAEKEQKDFNKQILEGGGALDYMSKGTDSLHENLNVLRKGMLDYTNLTEMGMGADEVRSTLISLQEANITLKEMAPAGASIKEQLSGAIGVMKELKTISTVFGLSMDEATSHVETLHTNLGKTLDDAEDMKNIKNAFDSIRDAATQAGYSNKKFFSTIIGVTNEVNSMNGRVAEAGTLFLKLKKLMGKKGEKLFEEAKQGYEGKSFQEKYTDVFKVGQRDTKKILEREALTKSISLFGKGGKGGIYGGEQGKEIQELFTKIGVDIKSLTEGNKEQITKLSKMSIEDRAKFLGEVRTKQGADVANTLQDLISIAQGARGGTIGAQTQALGKVSMGGNLAMRASKFNFLSLTPEELAKIDLTSEVNQKLLEDEFGETAEAMRDLMERSRGDYLSANELVKKYRETTDQTEKDKIEADLKAKGMEIKGNQLIASSTGLAINSLTDFIQSFPEQFQKPEDMENHQKTQEDLLQESIDATVSSSDVIATILKEKLDFLGDYTSWIFSWLSGGTDREKKIQEQEKLKNEIRELEKQRSEDKNYVNDLKKQVNAEKDPTKKADLKKKLEDAEAGLKGRQTEIEYLQGTSRAFRGVGVSDVGTAKNIARYESAKSIFESTEGDEKAKYAAVEQAMPGGWAVAELQAREKLKKESERLGGGDNLYSRKLKELESGGGGGSAFEEEKKQLENQLKLTKNATRDPLTGLPLDKNLADRESKLKQQLEEAKAKRFGSESQSAISKLDASKKADKDAEEAKKADEEAEKKKEENKIIAESAKASIDALSSDSIKKDEKARLEELAQSTQYKKWNEEQQKAANDDLIKKQKEEKKKEFEEAFTKFAQSKGTNIQSEDFKKKLESAYGYSQIGSGWSPESLLQYVDAVGGATPTAPLVTPPQPTPVQDLLISSKGAFKLDSKDDVVAMKPGGAIDQYMKGKGAGSVTININGGDEARIFEVVKKAMQSAGVVTQGGR